MRQRCIAGRGLSIELLEVRNEVERLGIKDRELFFDADRAVGRLRECFAGLLEIDQTHER